MLAFLWNLKFFSQNDVFFHNSNFQESSQPEKRPKRTRNVKKPPPFLKTQVDSSVSTPLSSQKSIPRALRSKNKQVSAKSNEIEQSRQQLGVIHELEQSMVSQVSRVSNIESDAPPTPDLRIKDSGVNEQQSMHWQSYQGIELDLTADSTHSAKNRRKNLSLRLFWSQF